MDKKDILLGLVDWAVNAMRASIELGNLHRANDIANDLCMILTQVAFFNDELQDG